MRVHSADNNIVLLHTITHRMMATNTQESAKQNDKTIEFWDAFYEELNASANSDEGQLSDEKNYNDVEWIVSDKPAVLDKILSLFPRTQPSSPMRILEIGCGVSQLSKSLLQRMIRQQDAGNSQQHAYEFVSTDVSLVCLEHNRVRDAAYTASLPDASSLSYTELNVVKELPISQLLKYDVVLDKGTCDTFLFRSKRTQKGSTALAPLLKLLLNNVHRLLRSDCKAKYIIISPRSKLKSVQKFKGFCSVHRSRMSTELLGDAVLVRGNAEHKKPAHVFIYECTRNDSYHPDTDEPFIDEGLTSINNESICGKCHMTFKAFIGNVNIQDQGAVQWTRRFRNHIIHCTGNCYEEEDDK